MEGRRECRREERNESSERRETRSARGDAGGREASAGEGEGERKDSKIVRIRVASSSTGRDACGGDVVVVAKSREDAVEKEVTMGREEEEAKEGWEDEREERGRVDWVVEDGEEREERRERR